MKSILGNSRQTGLAIILVGLMLMIIGFGQYFESKLKVATLIQNNIGSFKRYEALKGKISYNLPGTWIASEGTTSKEKVIHFNEFVSDDANTRGFIEVTETKEDIRKILEIEVKEIQGMGIHQYYLDELKINNNTVQVVKYNINASADNVKKVYNYLIKKDDILVKISFVMKDKTHKENTPVFLENIINTFNFK